MPRMNPLASALILALAGTSVAQAQEFTNVISFGDSLSDAGNVAVLNGLPAGNSFTTNPDDVAVQLVAAAFGYDQTNISALFPSTGTNYAYGGACVRADSLSFNCVNSPDGYPFSLTDQLNFYLASTGGAADGNALYTVWGGANDIFTYATLAGGGFITASQAQQLTGLSALTEVSLIGALQDAGANYVVVFNLPDIGLTPQFYGTPAQASISGLSFVFNDTLNTGLGTLGDGIIPINVNGLVNEVIADPTAYGFTNVTGIACGPGGPGVASSVACGPAGSGLPFTYADGTNDTYFFADGVHPTGAAHRLLAQAVVATIQAPGQVSVAGEVPLQVYEDHAGAINNQIFAGLGANAAVGDTRVWGNAQFGDQQYDAAVNTGRLDSKLVTLSFGADYRYSDNTSFGAAISFGGSNGDYGSGHGAGIDGREILASVYGVWNFGGAYLDAIASAGSNSLDIDRAIVLGPTTRIDSGSTDAKHMAFELGGGYLFGSADGIQHGPFASVTWQKVDVNGYAEDNADSTSMYFNDFTRKSLVGRLGWQIKGSSGAFHPFARIAWAKENKDDITRVQAGSNSMNGHFTMDGFAPAKDWVEADIGVGYDLNDTTTLTFGYRGHLNDDTQSRNSVNLGFRMSFGNAAPAVVPETEPDVPANSCADLDDDGDGVNNCDDTCPASTAGQAVGPDGCAVPLTIDLKGVNFDFDKATLRPDATAILDEAISILSKYPELKVEVAGHTDSIGSEQYNQGLSERRAKAVYDYLADHGIDASRMSGPVGYGETRPLAPNTNEDGSDNPEGRAQNRRTELDVQN